MIAMENNLTIAMTYLQLETRIMHNKNLSKQIFWQLLATQNFDRHSSFVE